jgi:hypothetical protein
LAGVGISFGTGVISLWRQLLICSSASALAFASAAGFALASASNLAFASESWLVSASAFFALASSDVCTRRSASARFGVSF